MSDIRGDIFQLRALVSELRELGVSVSRIQLPSGLVVEFNGFAQAPEPLETIDDAKAEKERKSELARALHV